MLAFARLPGQPKVHTSMMIFYDGLEKEAKKFLEPVVALDSFMNQTAMKSYTKVTDPTPPMNSNHNRVSTTTATLVSHVDAKVIHTLIEDLDAFLNKYGNAVTPSKVIIELRSYRISAAIDPAATAYRSRAETIFMMIEADYDDLVSNEVMRAEIKAIADKVKAAKKQRDPKSEDAFNFNATGGVEKVKDAYGDNYPRLREGSENTIRILYSTSGSQFLLLKASIFAAIKLIR